MIDLQVNEDSEVIILEKEPSLSAVGDLCYLTGRVEINDNNDNQNGSFTLLTEPTFSPIDSWDSWRPYTAWRSTNSRWTFAKNDATYEKITIKLVFVSLSVVFFQLASVLVVCIILYSCPPYLFWKLSLWKVIWAWKGMWASFLLQHTHVIVFYINAVVCWKLIIWYFSSHNQAML